MSSKQNTEITSLEAARAARRRERRMAQAIAREKAQAASKFFSVKPPPLEDEICAAAPASSLRRPDQFTALVKFIVERKARFAARDYGWSLANLSNLKWVRSPESWEPAGKSRDTQFRSLVDHLLVKYPVPKFLYAAFSGNPDQNRTRDFVEFFGEVAKGESVYKTAQVLLPLPVTRKWCSAFMTATVDFSIMQAVRWAQVEVYSTADVASKRRLVNALMSTMLGRDFQVEEDFWATVIQWFCNQAMFDVAQVGPIVDYIRHCRGETRDWTIRGRTVTSIVRDMEHWHGVLAKIRVLKGSTFAPSGFQAYRHESDRDDDVLVTTITEILSSKDLADEGRDLKHCVYSYGHSIESGRCSIWSLRQQPHIRDHYIDPHTQEPRTRLVPHGNEQRFVTIEVSNAQRTIVQARGKMNRVITSAERNYMNRWAGSNGIEIGSYL